MLNFRPWLLEIGIEGKTLSAIGEMSDTSISFTSNDLSRKSIVSTMSVFISRVKHFYSFL